LNEGGGDICSGPTGENGSYGWGMSNAAQQSAQRACIERVYETQAEATLSYIDCVTTVNTMVRNCLDDSGCSDDISSCVDLSKDGEVNCNDEAGEELRVAIARECGGSIK